MLPLRRPAATLTLLLAAVLPARAAEWKIPPLTGDLAGDFQSLRLGEEAPSLHWKVSARDAAEGKREVTGTVEGPGARIKISAALDAAANGTWRIEDAEIDLSQWYGEIVAWAFGRKAKFNVTGMLRVTGEGAVRAGVPEGRAVCALREGRFDGGNRKKPVALEGIALDLAFEDISSGRTASGQELTWRGGHYGPVTVGAGKVRFALRGDRVEVETATLGVFAGELALEPFGFSLLKPEFDAPAQVHAIEMAMLLPYMPNIVADARGKLDGSLVLHWDEVNEFSIGKGALALRTGEKAEIRFLPQPGLLAGALPPTLTKYYTGLADLEQGKVPLRANAMSLTYTRDSNAEELTVIHLEGGPADPRLVAPVDLTFNVRGPLQELLNLGMKL